MTDTSERLTFERPVDHDSERIVAGSVMAQPSLIDDLADLFNPADFSDRRLADVWHAVDEIRHGITDGPIGWLAVDRQLQRWRAEGHLAAQPFSTAHLSELYDQAMPAMAPWHAAIVATKAIAARGVSAMLDGRQRFMRPDFDPVTDIPAIQANLDALGGDHPTGGAVLVRELYPDAVKAATTPPAREDRVPTGLEDLDSLLGGGFAPGRLVIVGARPGVGKTTLANNLARSAALRHKLPTLFNSLEMTWQELMACLLAAEGRLPLHHVTAGTLDAEQIRRLGYLEARINEAPLYIDDSTAVSLNSLRGQVRHLVRKVGLRVVIVDYLQLMQAPKAESRQVAVSALSRGLKLLAKEFGIVVVALCQLNRGLQQRQDKRPTSSDLRESGSLEQDADMVILLHREDIHDRDSARAGEIELIVDKHRGGPRAVITCAYQGHYARVIDMGGTTNSETAA